MKGTVAILGLWYVWLPLAYHFARQWYPVIGFDVAEQKLTDLRQGIDTTEEIGPAISEVDILYTNNPVDLKQATYLIVTVPTPIDHFHQPDFSPLIAVSTMIGSILQKWQIVVYESTVYPGCTEELCIPLLEKNSWLLRKQDFHVGYSPERINPGDKTHTVDKITKVVAGDTPQITDQLCGLYGAINNNNVFAASSIAVAEAAKIIENTQRDINIALMNELKRIFDAWGIDIREVLEAAKTKRNFLPFHPWMVWGHCIGVDPYWLAYKAAWLGVYPEMILAGRNINDSFAPYLASQLIKKMTREHINPVGAKILILGLTFKPDVPDFRNSKVGQFIHELKAYWCIISAHDPYMSALSPHDREEFGLAQEDLVDQVVAWYDIAIKTVDHAVYKELQLKENSHVWELLRLV